MAPRTTITQILRAALGLTAALGCATSDDAGTLPQEDGVYRYVLGHDSASGRSFFGGAHAIVIPEERGKVDAIDQPNTPSRLHPALGGAEYKKWDQSLTTGQSDWDVFASSWWPQSKNGIAQRWTGGSADYNVHTDRDNLSPVEKYDVLYHPGQKKQVAAVEHWNVRELDKPEAERPPKHKHDTIEVAGPATAWEVQNHGNYQSYAHPDSWWGHCNGWASYATTEKLGAPARDIRVKLVAGKITECAAGEADCLLFRMGDIEALMSELYFSDQATFAGRRCNTDPDKIERDEFGRPKDPACRDLNAGSFHIGVTGLLSRGAKHLGTGEANRKPAFVIDHNYDWEVWNFPLVRYEILEQEEIDEAKAASLVGAQNADYKWNADAARFVRVRMKYWMISDGVSGSEMLKQAKQRDIAPQDTELNYVLELKADGTIIGGEWTKRPEVSWGDDSKKLHPDFYWMATAVNGAGETGDDEGGDDDNPFIKYSAVKALLACSNDATTCAAAAPPPPPGPTPGADSCADNCGKQASGGCWCDPGCTNYNDCCTDYAAVCTSPTPPPPAGATCAGHCGDTSAVPGSSPPCYCDSTCAQYGDCCSDKIAVCGE